ncbi:Lysine histidine transporter 1 [Auxenochlorella protothecoides]|uniref:Lysine histidine transporter 1 n=1 Tax=Auxenochlorella protothecoides TaxID=3075 RepID=A0A087SJI2_AUXPR|nr:Lysine histidine transporter 1 [Auxenochlorella protothecoides]KFM25886.1 Lysine histidine transporter 1 [Auxenochlorella protothecoides]RMZ55855.1 hypothetical protein APUTEX25_003821 [Auxenochlorella protothecoides]|eukprot:RMZ55855.1 hypothetical protein APUTEX25_003821 [Auxenochlorella protothecoides]
MAPPNEPAAVGVVRFSSLHDVPASFVEANGATDPLAPRPGTLSRLHKSLSTFSSSTSLLPHSSSCTFQEPTGTWFQGCYYLVATVGAPFTLSLPNAFARLGWAGGTTTVLVAYLATLWCATRMAHLHEFGGVRRTRYRDLGVAVLGPRLGRALVTCLQLVVNTGMCTIYPVICGQALQGAYTALCGLRAGTHCLPSLSPWIAGFSGAQLLLVVLPDIASLAPVQAAGALTTLGFCFLAVLGCILHGRDADVSYAIAGSVAGRLFPAFSALGSITLLFGNTVLVETQAVLAARPSAVPPMRRAALVGYTVICALVLAVVLSGYWAFGAGVDSLVFNSIRHPIWLVVLGNFLLVGNGLAGYLMFAHSVFDWVDTRIALAHWTGLEYRDSWAVIAKRLSFRWAFVAATGFLAVALPFITDLMGLVGSVGYAPLCFILPCVMWMMARGAALRRWERALCLLIAALFVLVGLLAAVGSAWSIVDHATSYAFFS